MSRRYNTRSQQKIRQDANTKQIENKEETVQISKPQMSLRKPEKNKPIEYIVEEILEDRIGKNGRPEYFVKWEDYDDSENTWEGPESFDEGHPVLEKYKLKKQAEELEKARLAVEKEAKQGALELWKKMAEARDLKFVKKIVRVFLAEGVRPRQLMFRIRMKEPGKPARNVTVPSWVCNLLFTERVLDFYASQQCEWIDNHPCI